MGSLPGAALGLPVSEHSGFQSVFMSPAEGVFPSPGDKPASASGEAQAAKESQEPFLILLSWKDLPGVKEVPQCEESESQGWSSCVTSSAGKLGL